MRSNPLLLPSIAVVFSGAIWGLYWIPVRRLDAAGISASWSSFVVFGLVAFVFIAVFLLQWLRSRRLPLDIIVTGLISGTCVVFYAVSFVLTDVVKTVLLFYLTPVWSTIMGRFLLNEEISRVRVVAVIFGLVGLAVILGVADGIPRLSNLGDLLALMSGILWSYATVRIRDNSNVAVWEQVGSFYCGGALAALVFILLPIEELGKIPSISTILGSFFWLAILIAAFLPSVFLIFWASKQLSPARVGILLMTEIIFGVVSAALLSGEAFGLTQMIGVALIFGAAVVDFSDRFIYNRLAVINQKKL